MPDLFDEFMAPYYREIIPRLKALGISTIIDSDGGIEPLVRWFERAGLEVLDVETMRAHYARTLVEWLGRLERRFPEAVQLVGKRRARAFRLYLASTAVTFRTGRVTVAQVLLQKGTGGEPAKIDRLWWYRDLISGASAPRAHGEG